MLKKGFELLKRKTTTFNITELEQQYNVTLPPLFKLFLNYFDICGNYILFDGVWLEDSKIIVPYSEVYFKPLLYPIEYGIAPDSYAKSLPQLFERFHNDRFEQEWVEYGMYRIFTIPFGAIFVGTRVGEEDAIFRIFWEIGDCLPEKIANNIFEFIDGLEEVPMYEELFKIYGFQLSQLYQNWGEGFWRIREDKSE